MKINEVSKITKLTKKAIEYYTLQGLVVPSVLENGYRNYTNQDIDILNKISVLRRLNISIEDIRLILNDKSNSTLRNISIKRELDIKNDAVKMKILDKLSQGSTYDDISVELYSLDQNRTISEKLLTVFPGCYGRFICLHFARFLDEPIISDEQQLAYETIISFLDNLPDLDIPSELEEYLNEFTNNIGTQQISSIIESTKQLTDNPKEYLSKNKEMLHQYQEYKKTEEYKNSPGFKLMELMKVFNESNGYNEIFISSMKKLSPSYEAYSNQLEIANKLFLDEFSNID